jgi:hypothetical protein
MPPYLFRVEFQESEGTTPTPPSAWLKFPSAPKRRPTEERRLKEIRHSIKYGSKMKETFQDPRYYTATSQNLRWAFFRSLVMQKVL